MSALAKEERYTIDYIESLPDGQRAELIDGELYMMASPSVTHQDITMAISASLYSFIRSKGGKCRTFPAPFAVYINGIRDEHNYFEPDISVICDPGKLSNGRGCDGAPDMIVEITSPSTAYRDRELKLNRYRDAGVREYWIVSPKNNSITVHSFEHGEAAEYSFADSVPVGIFDGELTVCLEEAL